MNKTIKKLVPLMISAILVLLSSCKGNDTISSSGPSDTESSTKTTNSTTSAAVGLTVKYVGGDGTVGTAPKERNDIQKDETIALPNNSFEKEGYVFNGWSDGAAIYQPTDFYKVTKDITFTAQWKESDGKIYIFDGEDIGGWTPGGANTLVVTNKDVKQGQGSFEAKGNGDIVIENWSSDINLSKYADKGKLHMWLYVSNAAAITGGQFEFTSSGLPDSEEIHFGEFGSNIKLKDGWNELNLSFESTKEQGGVCAVEMVNCVRFYLNNSGEQTVRVDDVYVAAK